MSAADPTSGPTRVFAALGEPTRLALVVRLSRGGAASIATLSAETRLTRQAVTKHLRVLEEAGLVGHARSGREVHFGYRPAALGVARDWIAAVEARWDDALERLRVLVDDQPPG